VEAGTRHDGLRLTLEGAELKHLAAGGTIPGVLVLAAAGACGPGTGRIRHVGRTLAWQAPGSSSYGQAVAVNADGDYLLEDGQSPEKWLRVRVWTAYLIDGAEGLVVLSEIFGGISGPDIGAAEATAGNVLAYQVGIENVGVVDALEVKIWRDEACGLELSLDGLVWVSPDEEDHADVLMIERLAAGQTTTLHLRRTIAPGSVSETSVLDLVKMSWMGY
jgi:hypothetical protein